MFSRLFVLILLLCFDTFFDEGKDFVIVVDRVAVIVFFIDVNVVITKSRIMLKLGHLVNTNFKNKKYVRWICRWSMALNNFTFMKWVLYIQEYWLTYPYGPFKASNWKMLSRVFKRFYCCSCLWHSAVHNWNSQLVCLADWRSNLDPMSSMNSGKLEVDSSSTRCSTCSASETKNEWY